MVNLPEGNPFMASGRSLEHGSKNAPLPQALKVRSHQGLGVLPAPRDFLGNDNGKLMVHDGSQLQQFNVSIIMLNINNSVKYMVDINNIGNRGNKNG